MTYPAGCTVEHAKFGVGIVTLGGDERVNVLFDDGEERRLLTHLAGLRRVAAQIRPRTDAELERELRRTKRQAAPRVQATWYAHRCQRCGGEWRGLKAKPKFCRACGSKDWQVARVTYRHHCYQCGADWAGNSPSPQDCPKCRNVHWNDPNYVARKRPVMCKCGAMTKREQARSVPHHYCDPNWRQKNVEALNAAKQPKEVKCRLEGCDVVVCSVSGNRKYCCVSHRRKQERLLKKRGDCMGVAA